MNEFIKEWLDEKVKELNATDPDAAQAVENVRDEFVESI